ncbi:MAG: hypothetical protein KDB14_01870 [Planctomycetales bacterium]|nr:hypothetical protein [Planctomycetales bacterium]
MGFSLIYESRAGVPRHTRELALERLRELNIKRRWRRCEALRFQLHADNDPLRGESFVYITSIPDERERERAGVVSEARPAHLVENLCLLSHEFEIDWDIYWAPKPGALTLPAREPLGAIVQGRCDDRLLEAAATVEPLRGLIHQPAAPAADDWMKLPLSAMLIDEFGADLSRINIRLCRSTCLETEDEDADHHRTKPLPADSERPREDSEHRSPTASSQERQRSAHEEFDEPQRPMILKFPPR